MRTSSCRLNFVFFLMGLLYIGCTDHGPQTNAPQVTTGNMAVINPDLFRFAVNLNEFTAEAIKEFGVVYSVQYYDVLKAAFTDKPELGWSKILFTDSPSNALHTKDVVAPATSFFRIYYRAYAVLNNGSTLYGEVKSYQQDKSERAILEFVGVPKLAKPYHAGVILLDLGQKPIKNFGVVYSYNTAANQAIKSVPTIADKSIKFSYEKVKIPVGGAGIGFLLDNLADNSINEIYVRSFVEYTDGAIDYGRYIGHAKK
ncbi:hypothetical protein LZD49_06460 [Dyadobacter sp. CY261]|uniref:hypothetical protein n=1 Tax=Dyadobacter sp. CY261 TaxID=2907203 RepID=UPI001F3ABFA8|nr:hypothetical protein [Dyadobacter sp. CY261]MCF0070107.1 hypothetical protein [Dyadobacter sp. CY261]